MISVFGCKVGKEEIKAVTECLESQWLGLGSRVSDFEKKFSEKFGHSEMVMVDNCSNGLYMACKLLNLALGSKIIVPSFTWVACAQAIILAGHRPIFADVDPDTMNITHTDVEECLLRHPDAQAVIVVHYAGLSVNMDPIMDLGLPVIEDCAHAVDSTYKGRSCGSIGDIGVFSFDSIKNLTTIDGGGIVSKDAEIIERAKVLRYCGIGKSGFENAQGDKSKWWEYDIQECFIRALPTNINASVGLAQLKKIDKLQKRRHEVWNRYQDAFEKLDWIKRPWVSTEDRHSCFTYAIRVDGRDKLARFLLGNGVYTTVRYHPLHMNPIYKQTDLRLPNCETLNDEVLNLPLHPRLTDGEVDKIIDLVKRWPDG
jgi:dTDP-4-amino-4,6-dideoxygalactose transaminase